MGAYKSFIREDNLEELCRELLRECLQYPDAADGIYLNDIRSEIDVLTVSTLRKLCRTAEFEAFRDWDRQGENANMTRPGPDTGCGDETEDNLKHVKIGYRKKD